MTISTLSTITSSQGPSINHCSSGEHDGVLCGHNPAFARARAALERWKASLFHLKIDKKTTFIDMKLDNIAASLPKGVTTKRRLGMFKGLSAQDLSHAKAVSLMAETCGSRGIAAKRLLAPTPMAEMPSEGADILVGTKATVLK